MAAKTKSKTNTEMYLVMETAWEYNDEYYYSESAGSGYPRHFYTTKEKAEAVKLKLTKAFAHSSLDELRQYPFFSENHGYIKKNKLGHLSAALLVWQTTEKNEENLKSIPKTVNEWVEKLDGYDDDAWPRNDLDLPDAFYYQVAKYIGDDMYHVATVTVAESE